MLPGVTKMTKVAMMMTSRTKYVSFACFSKYRLKWEMNMFALLEGIG